jgi:molybdenum cofactor guanylyltransferase
MHKQAVAIVPAGGGSVRLAGLVGPGGKAALEVGGESLLGRVCRVLAGEVNRVIVVTAADRPLPELPPTVEVIHDRQPGRGPLAAICDGLAHAAACFEPPRVALLAACDLPWLSPRVVRRLVATVGENDCRWVVPVSDGHPQVLASAVAVDLRPRFEEAVAAGRLSLRDLLAQFAASEPAAVRMLTPTDLASVAADQRSFVDIDTPEDLSGLDPGMISPA